MLSLGQILLNLRKELDFKGKSKGRCVHYVEKAIDAFLTGTYINFNKMKQFIIENHEQYPTFFKNAKEERKACALLRRNSPQSAPVIPEEQHQEIFDVAAFLEQGDLYHKPNYYEDIFGERLTQHDTQKISYYAQSTTLAKVGGRSRLATFNGIYVADEVTDLFRLLNQLATKAKHNFAISLTNFKGDDNSHRIGFGFNAETKSWTFIDILYPDNTDEIPATEETSDQLARLIRWLFSNEEMGVTLFRTEISSLTCHKQNLEGLVNDFLTSDPFKLIHNITSSRVNLITSEGNTLAMLAAWSNDTVTLSRFVEEKHFQQLNSANKKGFTPAYYAVEQIQALEILISARLPDDHLAVDFNIRDKAGNSPAFHAVSINQMQPLQALIELESSGKPVVNLNASTNEGATPTFIAAQKGRTDALQLLIDAKMPDGSPRVDLNQGKNDGVTPVLIATYNKRTQIVQQLIEAKMPNGLPAVDFNKTTQEGATPVFLAVQNADLTTLEVLIEAKHPDGTPRVDANKATNFGSTPAYLAASKGYTEILKALIGHDMANSAVDLNYFNDQGATPAFIAAQNGHVDILNLLADAQADLNLATQRGATPVMVAIEKGHAEALNALLKLKRPNGTLVVDINKANRQGVTPIILAAVIGNFDAFKTLITLKMPDGTPVINWTKASFNGKTLAMIAAEKGHSEICQMLKEIDQHNAPVKPSLFI